MDLDTLKLIAEIPLGVYAVLVIIDACLLRQRIKETTYAPYLPRQQGLRISWYWFCIRHVLALKNIRCHITLYMAVRDARQCLAKSRSARVKNLQ